MSIYALVVAVALWCGAPINQTSGFGTVKTGTEITKVQVQQCREKIIKCLNDGTKLRCFTAEKALGE